MSEQAKTTSEIVEYNATTAALAELKIKFAGVTYDVTTTAGMNTAKKDRRTLVSLRTVLEAKRKEIKEPALNHCKMIDAEAKRITAEIEALETPIDNLIKAEEKRKADEKAEKERKAAEAKKILEDKIIVVSKLPLRCVGQDSASIATFLANIEAKEISADFTGEIRERAEAAKAGAVAEIKKIHAATVDAEEKAIIEAKRIEEEKAEHERLMAIEREKIEKQHAELAEQKRLFDEETARLKVIANAEAAKLADEQREVAEKQAAIEAEKKRIADAEESKRLTEEAEKNATVTILKSEYESLLEDHRILCALRACGVDNWDGYGDAISSIKEAA